MQSLIRESSVGSRSPRLVVGVEHERSISGSHEHVAGVWTSADEYFTRDDVLRSLEQGDAWWTFVDGRREALRRVTHCPWPGCSMIPYLLVSERVRVASERGSP